MKCGARVAGAMATGYMLGRTKKMKLALMMGSWAAGQKFGSPAQLLSKGTDLLRKSPEFAQLNDEVRVKLIDAGKAAVAAAAAQRLTKLTDSVGSSAERIASGGPLRVARPDEDDGDKPRRSLLRFRRRGDTESAEPADVDESDVDEDRPDETGEDTAPPDTAEEDTEETSAESEQDGDAVDERPAPRRRRAPATPAAEKTPAKRASSGGSGGRARTPRASSGAKTAAAAKRTTTAAAKPAARGGKAAAGRRGAK